jgi:hypothetical protein
MDAKQNPKRAVARLPFFINSSMYPYRMAFRRWCKQHVYQLSYCVRI